MTETPTPTSTRPGDPLDDVFAALANSTRRSILARLADGEATVNELAAPFDLTLPAVSKHIKVLERAGLVTRDRRAQYRPCAIDPEPLRTVVDWVERYRQLWDSSFDRLELYLRREPSPGGTNHTASTEGDHDDPVDD